MCPEKRAAPRHRAVRSAHREHDDGDRGAGRPVAQRRPRHERQRHKRQRPRLAAGSAVLGEHAPRHHARHAQPDCKFHAADKDRPHSAAAEGKHERRAEDHSHRVARPPRKPRREPVTRQPAGQRERSDTAARAHEHPEHCRQSEEDDVPLAIERRAETDAPQRPHRKQGAERIADRDRQRGRQARDVGEIHRQRAERDAGPAAGPISQQCRDRDARRQPDERDVRAERWSHQPEPPRDEIGNGHEQRLRRSFPGASAHRTKCGTPVNTSGAN